MARKKKDIKAIVNGLEDNYIVEKARPLMLMKDVPFALGELKVLDTYLSRINARDPEACTVRFSKEEYEDLMGIERMRPERLGKYVESIMQKIITVPDENARGGWRKYTLFCMSECSQDENEQWWIDLTCTAMAKKLFFNLDNIGYIRYQLKNVLPLTSKYSVLLYLYLLDNRFRSKWVVSLLELREKIFRCSADTYPDFKYFKRDVLDKALKELNEKTDLTFTYQVHRIGRRAVGIQFELVKDEVTLPLEDDPAQLSIDDFAVSDPGDPDEPNGLYKDALPKELTPEEVETLRFMAVDKVEYDPFGAMPMEIRVADYLQHKHNLLRAYEAKHSKVKDKFAWLRKAISEDWT